MTGAEFHAEGWRSIESGQLPPRWSMVEFAREESVFRQPPWFGKWGEFDPQMNVAGLWWREA